MMNFYKNSIQRKQAKLIKGMNKFLKYSLFSNRRIRSSMISFFQTGNISSPLKQSHYLNPVKNYKSNLNIKKFLKQNPQMQEEVYNDFFIFLKESENEMRKEKYFEDEERVLKEFQNESISQFKQALKKGGKYKDYLKTYSKEQIDRFFYYQEHRNAQKNQLNKQKLTNLDENSLKRNLIQRWRNGLAKKVYNIKVTKIIKMYKEFESKQIKKITKFNRLKNIFNPYMNNIGKFWNMADSNFEMADFNVLKEYSDLLEKDKSIKQLSDLLGKFRKMELEAEKEYYEKTVIDSSFMINPFGSTELVGVHESNDFNHTIPSELALLADDQTEVLFYKKLLEKKLLTYQFVSFDKVEVKKTEIDEREKKIETDKGPYIICVDTSGSMMGEPERVAKVISFAILKKCLKEDRKAFLISFSTGIETFELTDINNSLGQLANFLRKSFNSGTDAVLALKESLKKMKENNYNKADLLFITDGEVGYPQQVINDINEQKEKENKFYSLIIGKAYNTKFLEIFDKNFTYNSQNMYKNKGIIQELLYTK